MENYQETKNEIALSLMIEAIWEEMEKTDTNRSEEFDAFLTKMEIVKDMLVNL